MYRYGVLHVGLAELHRSTVYMECQALYSYRCESSCRVTIWRLRRENEITDALDRVGSEAAVYFVV
jgi:hypothetical protein